MGPVEKRHGRPHFWWRIAYTKMTTTKSSIKTISQTFLMLPLNINLRFMLRTATNKRRLTTTPSTNPQASANSTSLPQEHAFGSQIGANSFGDWKLPSQHDHSSATRVPQIRILDRAADGKVPGTKDLRPVLPATCKNWLKVARFPRPAKPCPLLLLLAAPDIYT